MITNANYTYGHIVYQEWSDYIRVQWIPEAQYVAFLQSFEETYGRANKEETFYFKQQPPPAFNTKLTQLFELLFKTTTTATDEYGCVFKMPQHSDSQTHVTHFAMTPLSIVSQVILDSYDTDADLVAITNSITQQDSQAQSITKQAYLISTIPFFWKIKGITKSLQQDYTQHYEQLVSQRAAEIEQVWEAKLKELKKNLNSEIVANSDPVAAPAAVQAASYTDIEVDIEIPSQFIIKPQNNISHTTLLYILKTAFDYFPICDIKTYPKQETEKITFGENGHIYLNCLETKISLTLPEAVSILYKTVKSQIVAETIYDTLTHESRIDSNKILLDQEPKPHEGFPKRNQRYQLTFAEIDSGFKFDNLIDTVPISSTAIRPYNKVNDEILAQIIPGKVQPKSAPFFIADSETSTNVDGIYFTYKTSESNKKQQQLTSSFSIQLFYNKCTNTKSIQFTELPQTPQPIHYIENVQLYSTPEFKPPTAFKIINYVNSIIDEPTDALQSNELKDISKADKAALFKLLGLYFEEVTQLPTQTTTIYPQNSQQSDTQIQTGHKCTCALCSHTSISSIDQRTLIQHIVESLSIKSETSYVMSSELLYHIGTYINEINTELPIQNRINLNSNQISQQLGEFLDRKRRAAGMTFGAAIPDTDTIKQFAKETAHTICKKLINLRVPPAFIRTI